MIMQKSFDQAELTNDYITNSINFAWNELFQEHDHTDIERVTLILENIYDLIIDSPELLKTAYDELIFLNKDNQSLVQKLEFKKNEFLSRF